MEMHRTDATKGLVLALAIAILALASAGARDAHAVAPGLAPGTFGQFMTKWGSTAAGDYQFFTPAGIAADPSGNVFVVDGDFNRVKKFDNGGTFLTGFGSSGSGNGQLDFPNQAATDTAGNLYVADTTNCRVQKFSPTGTFLAAAGTCGSANGQYFSPRGVAVDRAGNVYVTDQVNRNVTKLSSALAFVSKFGAAGTGNGQLAFPEGVAIAPTGDIWVADTGNHRIQKFSSAGAFSLKVGGTASGTGDGQFNQPTGIASDAAGNVYVTDMANHRIQKFAPDGTFLGKWGSSGTADGRFNRPPSVTVDAQGRVFVGDGSNSRIQKFGQTTLAYTEDQPAAAIDPLLDLADPDSSNLTGATVQITGNYKAGQDLLSFTAVSGITGTLSGGTLTFTGTRTVANYRTILRSVKFATGDDPGNATRTVSFTATDGTTPSATITRDIAVTPVNDAPTAVADTLSVDEDTPGATAAPGVLSNDTDPDSSSLSVDQVAGGAGNVGVVVTTAKGAKATISADGSVAYDPDGKFESLATGATATDSITYRTSDGALSSGTATLTVTITGVDDKPVLGATSAALAYTENDAPTAIDSGFTTADVDDANLESATVTLTNPQPGDRLAYATTNGIGGSVAPDGHSVTLTGPGGVTDFQSALRAVTYENTSEDPSTTQRTVSFAASDGEKDAAAVTRAIDVTAVNDAPDTDDDTASTDEDTPVTLSAPGVLENDTDAENQPLTVDQVDGDGGNVGTAVTTSKGGKATISDVGAVTYDPNGSFESLGTGDSDTDSVTYRASDGAGGTTGATLTVTVDGVDDKPVLGATTDALAYTENDPPTAIDPALTAADVDDTDLDDATVTLTDRRAGDRLSYATTSGIVGSVAPDGHSVTLSGPGTVSDFEAALRAVTYENTSEDPSTAQRMVEFTASDGEKDATTVTRAVDVTAVNDAPTAAGDTLSVSEDTPGATPAPGVLGNDTDPDSPTLTVGEVDGDGAKVGALVTTATGAKAKIGADGSVQYDPDGQFESLGTGQTVTETISYRATDGALPSAAAELAVTVEGVNDRPVLTATGAPLAYTENGPPTAVDPGLAAADVDNWGLDGATVTLTDPKPGDRLAYVTTNGITGSVAPDGHSVTLSGDGGLAEYQAALRAVTYENTSEDPSTAPRTVTFVAGDGEKDSAPVSRTIAVGPVNDDPVAQPDTLRTDEDTPVTVAAPGVLGNDTDIDGVKLTVGAVGGSAAGVGQVVETAKGAKLTIAADGAVSYDPNRKFESLGAGATDTDNVTYRAADGAGGGATATLTIVVSGVDDPLPPVDPPTTPGTPLEPATALAVIVPGTRTVSRGGKAPIRITCTGRLGCRGSVTIRTAAPTTLGARSGAPARIVKLGYGRFAGVAPGATATLSVQLSSKGAAILAALRRVKVIVTVAVDNPRVGASPRRTTRTITLVTSAKLR